MLARRLHLLDRGWNFFPDPRPVPVCQLSPPLLLQTFQHGLIRKAAQHVRFSQSHCPPLRKSKGRFCFVNDWYSYRDQWALIRYGILYQINKKTWETDKPDMFLNFLWFLISYTFTFFSYWIFLILIIFSERERRDRVRPCLFHPRSRSLARTNKKEIFLQLQVTATNSPWNKEGECLHHSDW